MRVYMMITGVLMASVVILVISLLALNTEEGNLDETKKKGKRLYSQNNNSNSTDRGDSSGGSDRWNPNMGKGDNNPGNGGGTGTQGPNREGSNPTKTELGEGRGKILVKGKWGHDKGQFGRSLENSQPGPMAISRDSQGNFWVLDQENHRIQVFNSAGKFLREIPLTSSNFEWMALGRQGKFALYDGNDKKISLYGPQGTVLSEFNINSQLPVTEVWVRDGKVYVELSNNEVHQLDENGTLGTVLPGRPLVAGGSLKLVRVDDNSVVLTRYQTGDHGSEGHNVIWQKKLPLRSSEIMSLDTDNTGNIFITWRNFQDRYDGGERQIVVNEVKIMQLDQHGNYLGDTVLSTQNENDFRRNITVGDGGTVYQMTTDKDQGVQIRSFQIER